MLIPHYRNPLSREKDIPPPLSRVLVTIGSYKTHPLFRVSREFSRDYGQKIPPFPRKWKMAPLMYSSWGGGGGRAK